jgi:hypothetical protein
MIARLTNDVMLAQAFQVPNQLLTLDFDGPIPALGFLEVHFTIQQKNVSATTVYLQNNSPNTVYYDYNGVPANENSVQVAPGADTTIYNIMMSALTFYSTASTPINQNGGLIVRAFGSSELTRQRGQR